jgi:hypothetical protein
LGATTFSPTAFVLRGFIVTTRNIIGLIVKVSANNTHLSVATLSILYCHAN